MVLLKENILNHFFLYTQHLNSNMVLLKELADIAEGEDIVEFTFQYGTT